MRDMELVTEEYRQKRESLQRDFEKGLQRVQADYEVRMRHLCDGEVAAAAWLREMFWDD